MIGIDMDIIIILLPISILLAMAPSPESLQILTANSDKNAIPVIFINNVKNVLLIDALFANDCSNPMIPCNLSITNSKINTPVSKLMYIANSGLYCFNKIIMISAINAIPIILIISTVLPISFFILIDNNVNLSQKTHLGVIGACPQTHQHTKTHQQKFL